MVVSTFNEERYLGRCLDFLLEQDYPRELTHIVLVDGGSTDGTVAIARERSRREVGLTVIADGRRRNLPEALNLGLRSSSSELVAKVDAHGYPERDFLSRAVEVFTSAPPDVACVGGRPEQRGDTEFGEAVAKARTSRFGVGSSGYADTAQRKFVDTVQCGIYRRNALEAVGLFDPRMSYGEDDELNWRLLRAGHRILVDTRIRFHYITRGTWSGVYTQYRNYGRARARVVRAHPGFLRPHHLVPSALVVASGAFAAGAPFSAAARRALGVFLGAYGAGAAGSAVKAAGRNDAAVTARVASCFLAMHAGYGVGMLAELTKVMRDRVRHPGTPAS